MRKRFVVVGTIKDGERVISREIKNIREALIPLGDVHFFIVESDSQDGTVNTLQALAKTTSNFEFISLGKIEKNIPNRIDRLIFCRNYYLEKIKSDPKYFDFDFVVVADLDGVNKKLTSTSVERSITQKSDWAGIFANQSHRYYDLLALRHELWCPHNVFDEYSWLRGFISPSKAKSQAIYRRMIKIDTKFAMIPVLSAFGGFAIYRKSFFIIGSYSRTERDKASDIDHVILNRRITESGGRLFIDPQLINSSWTFHSLSSHAWFRFLAKMKNVLKIR